MNNPALLFTQLSQFGLYLQTVPSVCERRPQGALIHYSKQLGIFHSCCHTLLVGELLVYCKVRSLSTFQMIKTSNFAHRKLLTRTERQIERNTKRVGRYYTSKLRTRGLGDVCSGSDANVRFGARREGSKQRDSDAEADKSGQRAMRYSRRELYRHIQQPRRSRTNL